MPVFNQIIQQGQGSLGPSALQQIGPVFEAEIAIPSALEQILTQKQQAIPAPIKGHALIDTGATFSAVDESAMLRLGVPPVGLIQTGTADGQHLANSYPAKFTLLIASGSISFESPRATGVNLKAQPYVALIGRDVLANGILIYNGGMGIVTLAF